MGRTVEVPVADDPESGAHPGRRHQFRVGQSRHPVTRTPLEAVHGRDQQLNDFHRLHLIKPKAAPDGRSAARGGGRRRRTPMGRAPGIPLTRGRLA